MLERKTFPVAEFKVADKAEGVIEAIVSVFNNEDFGGDTVEQGFFSESLQRKLPKGVWMHDWSIPVAKTIQAEEIAPRDARLPEKLSELGGLYVKGQFNLNTQRGREAFSDIEFGIIDEFSFGYDPVEFKMDEKTGKRRLIKGDIYEWSPVLVGMNPATQLLSVKDKLGDGLPFVEHLQFAVDVAEKVAERTGQRQTAREKVGRELSSSNRDMLNTLASSLRDVLDNIDNLLSRTEPEKDEPEKAIDIRAEYARHAALMTGVRALQRSIYT